MGFSQNTVQRNLVPKENTEDVPMLTEDKSEKQEAASVPTFDPRAISIKGYHKKTSDSRESFYVTNNTDFHISHIKIRLRYTDMNGNMIDEKIRHIEIDLKAHETSQAAVTSFDKQRSRYYYLTPMRYTKGTPFKVAFELLRYDIVVE